MERRTRIWIGLGTALLVGSTGADKVAVANTTPLVDPPGKEGLSLMPSSRPRVRVAQVDDAGEGGPGEGGGAILGTITEFRLSSNDPRAFDYDAKRQVTGYVDLVSTTYAASVDAAAALREAVAKLTEAPTEETLEAAREAWRLARAAYLRTEAYQFYAGPIDGPGGPYPRLNAWPIDPRTIDALVVDEGQSLNFRAIAQLNRLDPPAKITAGLHVLEYLLWGADGARAAPEFAGDSSRLGAYAKGLAQLFLNDLTVVSAAWRPGEKNYRSSVEAMDQRNALGRAFNGMTVLLGYEMALRRIGAGLFPANKGFESSPYSASSADDNRFAFEGARNVYFGTGLDKLVQSHDAELGAKVEAGFDKAAAALSAMDAPYGRFIAPVTTSPERATADAAVRALTDLARDLRQAGNLLGILVVVPGM